LVMEQYVSASDRKVFHEPPVEVFYGDGRRFVKRSTERYDMVILNVPDPSTAMLNRFYTLEFYNEVQRILSPGGVMVTRLSAPVDYYGFEVGNYAGSVYRTLKAVFPYVVITPTEETYFFASSAPGVVTSDIGTLTKRWLSRGIHTEYFTRYHFLMWWLPERVAFTRKSLESQSDVPINTDFKPITYFFNLVLWGRFSGSKIVYLLNRIEGLGVWWYIAPVLLIIALRFFYLAATGKRGDRQNSFHALLAIGTTGFTAMALEIVLIYVFQNRYGYVYQMIGLIVAIFMTGLACGSFVSNRLLLNPGRRWVLWLSGMEFTLASYSVIVPWLVRHLSSESEGAWYAFMVLVFLAGVLTGAEFPLGSKIYMRYAANLGYTAALVDCYDHFGACIGSLFIGVIFVPILGLNATCIFLFVINVATGTLLLTAYGCRAAWTD
jgi:predicted membrane-bound spermidine synthase